MPRRSAAELAISSVKRLPSRLKPPGTLSELARAEFLRIVTAESPIHFKKSDLSLLIRYCEGAALAERAEVQIRIENPPSARWLAAWREGTKVMKDLALRLRLSPQSRMPNNPKRESVSYYERMALEEPNDADDDA
jgi:hypothetical protein